MSNQEITPLVPREGWHVMHLFYHVDHAQWSLYSDEEQRQAKTRLTELVQEIRATPDTHLLIFSIATPKADLGFMLLTPDLHVANMYEKQLSLSLGPEILSPVYSYLSQTESSEYTTTREQYAAETLVAEEGVGAVEFVPREVRAGGSQSGLDTEAALERHMGVLAAPDQEEFAGDFGDPVEAVVGEAGAEAALMDIGRVETGRGEDVGVHRGAKGEVAAEADAHRADPPGAGGM